MSPIADVVEVVCPRCGETYAHWYHPFAESTDSSCPHCGHDPALDRLIHEDGVWSLAAEEDERTES